MKPRVGAFAKFIDDGVLLFVFAPRYLGGDDNDNAVDMHTLRGHFVLTDGTSGARLVPDEEIPDEVWAKLAAWRMGVSGL